MVEGSFLPNFNDSSNESFHWLERMIFEVRIDKKKNGCALSQLFLSMKKISAFLERKPSVWLKVHTD